MSMVSTLIIKALLKLISNEAVVPKDLPKLIDMLKYFEPDEAILRFIDENPRSIYDSDRVS